METEDFGAVYDEAGLSIPDHGYGVDKVSEMLQGKAPQFALPATYEPRPCWPPWRRRRWTSKTSSRTR